MRICDTCKKPIPLGTSDIIQVTFRGRFGDLLMKIHGTTNLDFDSLECFNKFTFNEKKVSEEMQKQ